jgi:uncharacterized protein YndB with AHSA1/START domain
MAVKTRGFAHRVDIAARPARVWTVLCGPALAPLWLGAGAKIKPQQGGRWAATLGPGVEREALIDVFDPPRRLRLVYLPPVGLEAFDGAVTEDILLEESGTETILRLLCSGVPDSMEWSAHYSRLRKLTESAITRLKILVEQRERMAAASRSKT